MVQPAPEHTRDLNPTPEARIAMAVWGAEYAASRRGSMSFWDDLPEGRKRMCRDILRDIIKAGRAHNRVEFTKGEDT